jgi:hypothetical protein
MYGHRFRPGKPQIKPANAEIAAAEKINQTYVCRAAAGAAGTGHRRGDPAWAAAGGAAARPPAAAVSSGAAGAADGA